jgi:branched-chain amino acid transport system ATP-binding protein
LFTQLTVREDLQLGSRRGGVSEDVLFEYFPELSERVDVRAGLLSGGEQQMLALGRALAGGPRILLIDEMSLGLAPVIVKRLLGLISTICKDFHASVLLVEQHIVNALEVSDRAYVLSHGDLVLEGESADLLGRLDDVSNAYLGAVL